MAAGWKRDDSSNGAPISENTSDDYDDGYPYRDGDSWWWSPTGMAVRYTVICIIFAAILVFFVGGYLHAKRRMRKGLPLLAYHRWMVHRSVRYQYQQPGGYNPYNNNSNNPDPYQEGYVMHGYAPPPPAYHRYGDAPPAYAPPPAGASKAMADQHYYNSREPRTGNEGESSEAAATSAVPRQ